MKLHVLVNLRAQRLQRSPFIHVPYVESGLLNFRQNKSVMITLFQNNHTKLVPIETTVCSILNHFERTATGSFKNYPFRIMINE